MSILPIVIQYLNVLKQILIQIFSVIMFTLILQSNIKCAHGLMRKVCKWWKTIPSSKQIKKIPKTTVCKECTYVQKGIDQIAENFDSLPDNEHIFSV